MVIPDQGSQAPFCSRCHPGGILTRKCRLSHALAGFQALRRLPYSKKQMLNVLSAMDAGRAARHLRSIYRSSSSSPISSPSCVTVSPSGSLQFPKLPGWQREGHLYRRLFLLLHEELMPQSNLWYLLTVSQKVPFPLFSDLYPLIFTP